MMAQSDLGLKWGGRGSVLLLVLNLFGAVAYVIAATPSWAIPAERAAGIYSITGEPFVWFAGIAPILTVFTVINFVWLCRLLWAKNWRTVPLYLGSAVAWVIAIVVDFAHH